MTRIETHGRDRFAEVAEVLGVKTNQILLVRVEGKILLVLFSEIEGDDTLSSVLLRRGQDGILFQATQAKRHPELWARIKEEAGKWAF